MKKAFFLGCNALGDTLCTTPVLRAFRRANPGLFVTYIVHNAAYCRVLEGNPDVDLVLYNEHLWVHGPAAIATEWLHSLPLDIEEPSTVHHFDMVAVCSRPESFQEHIAVGFSKLLGIPIDSVRPVVVITEAERKLAQAFVRKPYAVFSMHSNANPKTAGGAGAKDWSLANWLRLAEHLHADCGLDVLAVGSEKDPQVRCPFFRNLYGLPLKIVAALLQQAACVVTLENGIAHLCAGVNAPMVEIYSRIVPLEWAFPKEATRCRVLYADPAQLPYCEVTEAVDEVLFRPHGR